MSIKLRFSLLSWILTLLLSLCSAQTNSIRSDKRSYFVGNYMNTTYTSRIAFKEWDFIRIVRSTVTSNYFRAPFVYETPLFRDSGKTRHTKEILLTIAPGSYKLVIFREGRTIQLAVSSSFTVRADTILLSPGKAVYNKDQTMVAIFNSTNKVPFRYNDEIRVIDASITSNYNDAGWYNRAQLKDQFAGKSSGALELYVGWEAGLYKLVLFMENTEVPAVISSNFEVRVSSQSSIESNKATYFVGEYMNATYTSNVAFQEWDFIRIVRSTVSSNYFNAPFLYETPLFRDSGSTKHAKEILLTILIAPGTYKLLLFKEDKTVPSAISSSFTVRADTILLRPGKAVYNKDQNMVAIFNSTNKVPFRYNDEIRVIDASVTSNYYEAPWYNRAQLKDQFAGKSSGALELYVGWEAGLYKLVLFMENTKVPTVISSNFEVRDSSIESNKATYFVGEYMNATYTSNVAFQEWDFIRIVQSTVSSNYFNAPFLYETPLFRDSGSTKHTKEILLTILIAPGTYKLLLFKEGKTVPSAISSSFTVRADTILLRPGKAVYNKDQTMVAIFNSTNKVPFRYNDEIRVIDASVTSNYNDVGWYNRGQLKDQFAGKSSGALELYVGWEAGLYKLVLFMENTDVPTVISSNFEVRL